MSQAETCAQLHAMVDSLAAMKPELFELGFPQIRITVRPYASDSDEDAYTLVVGVECAREERGESADTCERYPVLRTTSQSSGLWRHYAALCAALQARSMTTESRSSKHLTHNHTRQGTLTEQGSSALPVVDRAIA